LALYENEMIEKLNASEIEEAWRLAFQLGYNLSLQEFHKNIVELEKQESAILVAKKGNKIGGFVVARVNVGIFEGIYGEIIALVVSKNFRRQGLGNALVSAAEAWLRKYAKKVRVRSNVQRVEAHDFYQSIGYIHAKTQTLYLKNV